jgi:hypothetical protein
MSGGDNWRFAGLGPRERKTIEAAPEAKRRRKLNRMMKEVGRQRTS